MKGLHVIASNRSAKFFFKYFETFLERIMDGSEVWLRSTALFSFMALVHTLVLDECLRAHPHT